MMGTRTPCLSSCSTIWGTAAAASSLLTVTRTSSDPARASAAHCWTVPGISAVSVLVIDCTTIGASEPTRTPPTTTVTVFLRGIMDMRIYILTCENRPWHRSHPFEGQALTLAVKQRDERPFHRSFWYPAHIMRLYHCLFFLTAIAGSVFAQDLSPVAERVTAQNALFEEQYETDLRNFPERATAYGDYRYNDKLADYSLGAIAERHKTDEALLAKLAGIPTTGFSDQDQLSHDVMVRVLHQRSAYFALKEFEMPVNQQNGIHTSLADLPLSVPLDSVKHYEDYVARLHQIPRALTQTTEVLRAGMKDKLMPVRFLLEKLPVQCEGIIHDDPFLIPTKKFPKEISAEDQKRLTQQIADAINTDVIPAYKSFAAFLRTEYAPQGRTALSITSLPDGEQRYENDIYARTTTHMTPDEIHQLGLREIDRIEAEMTAVAKKAGFADLASFRASLKTNPKYIPTSSEQILNDFRHYIAQMEPKLPELFTLLPKSPVTVEAIPSFQSAAATHYVTGTPDGKRPGRVVVATSDFAH